MADATELRCWPSCPDAIDWSQDGLIALASYEKADLLFPNTISLNRNEDDEDEDGNGEDVPQWKQVSLPVPLFSFKELPVKPAAPLSTYSIGEEISGNSPLAVSWSSPGLAKYRRCALATLTANLVLSIWAADGQPHEEINWRRKLIVNDALTKYFTNHVIDENGHLPLGSLQQIRLRSRVRAFTWAPALPSSDSPGIIGTRLLYRPYLLAVSNDDNRIAVVIIDSPTSTLGRKHTWHAQVLTHFSLIPDSESTSSGLTSFEDMMEQQRHNTHVSWSPWTIRGDLCRSVIVYATNNDVRARTVTYTNDSIEFGNEAKYLNVVLRFNGPMKWSPRIEEGDQLTLALFTISGLVSLRVSVHDASELGRASHDLDGSWDEISGAVWDSALPSQLHLHLSSLHSTLCNSTAAVELSADGFTDLPTPHWKEQIENNLALFSVKNDLKGYSKTKVWGLSPSPLGDFIMSCNSVHPSNMIEYGAPSERRGTIAISALRQYSQLRQFFPTRNVSAEGVLFTLTKIVDNTVETSEEIPAFVKDMVDKLMQAFTPLASVTNSHDNFTMYSDPTNLDTLVTDFKKATFMNTHTLRDRYTILVSQACKTSSDVDLSRALIAYRLAVALEHLPPSLVTTSFSAEVHATHHQLAALVDTLIGSNLEGAGPSRGDPSAMNCGNNSTADVATTNHLNASNMYLDKCDFCDSPIPFTDLTSAACANGHQFPRCGVSFVAIQAPGITKYCGICSTPFLSEEFVAAQEREMRQESANKATGEATSIERRETEPQMAEVQSRVVSDDVTMIDGDTTVATEGSNTTLEQAQHNGLGNSEVKNSAPTLEEEQSEPPITLARVLFLACDVCIYCGGKFIG